MPLNICIFKTVKITEFYGVIDDSLKTWILIQNLSSSMIHHSHTWNLMKQFPCIPFHQSFKIHILCRQICPDRTIINTGLIYHRKWHGILCHLKQFLSHTGTQHSQMWLLCPVFWLKSFQKNFFIKGSSFICPICFCKIFELSRSTLPAAFNITVKHIDHIQEIHLSTIFQYIINTANCITAIYKYQFFDISCKNFFQN